MKDIHLRYLRETGLRPAEEEIRIGVVRMRGLWVLDPEEIDDDEVLQIFGRRGELVVVIPDQDYIDYLERIIEEYESFAIQRRESDALGNPQGQKTQ